MRAGRIGRHSGYGGARWKLRLFVLAAVALALYCVITAPAQSADAVAHVAHQLVTFVRSFK